MAGVNSLGAFHTTAEYRYSDPVVLTSKEAGEMIAMPEQLDLLVGKAVNLARLQLKVMPIKIGLVVLESSSGEKNQGASNMNVPRSVKN